MEDGFKIALENIYEDYTEFIFEKENIEMSFSDFLTIREGYYKK